jgi:hypothetical protein
MKSSLGDGAVARWKKFLFCLVAAPKALKLSWSLQVHKTLALAQAHVVKPIGCGFFFLYVKLEMIHSTSSRSADSTRWASQSNQLTFLFGAVKWKKAERQPAAA